MDIKINRRRILKLGLAAVPIAAASQVWLPGAGLGSASASEAVAVRLASSSAPVRTQALMTRPTGAGIYAIENLGITGWDTLPGAAGLTKALAKVATLAAAPDGTRTLTLPEHVFSFNGFSQSANYLGLLVPASVGIVGSGAGTIIEVAQDSMTQAQSDSWERYGLSYGNVNLDAHHADSEGAGRDRICAVPRSGPTTEGRRGRAGPLLQRLEALQRDESRHGKRRPRDRYSGVPQYASWRNVLHQPSWLRWDEAQSRRDSMAAII